MWHNDRRRRSPPALSGSGARRYWHRARLLCCVFTVRERSRVFSMAAFDGYVYISSCVVFVELVLGRRTLVPSLFVVVLFLGSSWFARLRCVAWAVGRWRSSWSASLSRLPISQGSRILAVFAAFCVLRGARQEQFAECCFPVIFIHGWHSWIFFCSSQLQI